MRRVGAPDAPLRLGGGGEFDLIRSFLREAAAGSHGDVRVGPGDDCAVVGDGIALSSDMSVEDVHFRREWLEPEEIGWRAATAALSDLAAMAARPIGVLASVAIAARDAPDVAVALMRGVRRAAEAAGGVLLGGDLTRSPGPIVVDVTVVGAALNPVLRSGAAVGDDVWTTGTLGAAAAAVRVLLAGGVPAESLRERFARPLARIREARWIVERMSPTSLIDISDGLLGDAGHIAAASGVALVLERDCVPVHPDVSQAAGDSGEAFRLAVSGGEDYELCFTTPPDLPPSIPGEFVREFGIPLTRVGRVEAGEGVFWREGADSRAAASGGAFQHFAPPS